MKEEAELTWHATAIKGIHLYFLMMAILLLALTNPTKAEGLPKAEDGYLYYCAGTKADSFDRPNAFILFKLRKSKVRDDKNAQLLCVTNYVDERFVLKRFLEKDDVMLKGEVNFTIPLIIDGKEYRFEIQTGGGYSYLSGSNKSRFDTDRRVCGIEDQLDDNGLLPAKRPPKTACQMTSYKAFGSFEDSSPKLHVSCFGEEECLLVFFLHEWRFSIRTVPYSLLSSWREIHEKAVSAIDCAFWSYPATDSDSIWPPILI